MAFPSHKIYLTRDLSHTDLTNLTKRRVASLALVGFAECLRRMAHTSDSACVSVRFVRSV